MKRPYMNRFPPHEWNYQEKDVEATIYSCYERTPRDDGYDDEEEEYEDEEENEEYRSIHSRDGQEKNAIRKLPLDQITLQSLIDNLPSGITPADVKISMSIDVSAFAVEGTTLNIYYKKHLPARPELYKQEKAAYDKEYAEYEIKLKAFEEWERRQEVKKLEEKLAKLKK
jgi:hypothetical protein